MRIESYDRPMLTVRIDRVLHRSRNRSLHTRCRRRRRARRRARNSRRDYRDPALHTSNRPMALFRKRPRHRSAHRASRRAVERDRRRIRWGNTNACNCRLGPRERSRRATSAASGRSALASPGGRCTTRYRLPAKARSRNTKRTPGWHRPPNRPRRSNRHWMSILDRRKKGRGPTGPARRRGGSRSWRAAVSVLFEDGRRTAARTDGVLVRRPSRYEEAVETEHAVRPILLDRAYPIDRRRGDAAIQHVGQRVGVGVRGLDESDVFARVMRRTTRRAAVPPTFDRYGEQIGAVERTQPGECMAVRGCRNGGVAAGARRGSATASRGRIGGAGLGHILVRVILRATGSGRYRRKKKSGGESHDQTHG